MRTSLYSEGIYDVLEDGNKRYLYVCDGCQGVMVDNEPGSPYMLEIIKHAKAPRTALVLGSGACLIPTALQRSGAIVDLVDNDKDIFGLAEKFFGYKKNGEHFVSDAAEHLMNTDKKYDFIVFDAYDGYAKARKLYTQPMYERASNLLNPNGVLALNLVVMHKTEADVHEHLLQGVFGEVGKELIYPSSNQYVLWAGN